jgi:integrase
MATLWKHPNSRFWTAQYIDADGKRVKRSTKQEGRKTAQGVADAWEDAASMGRAGELTQAAGIRAISRTMEVAGLGKLKTPTIQEALDLWYASRKDKRSDATATRYKAVKKSFCDFFPTKRLNASIRSLTRKEIEEWRDSEIQSGKAGSSADFGVTVIRGAMNWMLHEELMINNPAMGIDPSDVSSPETREPFTDDEVRCILLACDTEWLGMVLFSAWHSLRLGDAASLTWGNIDTERWTLSYIPKKTRRKLVDPLVLVLAFDVVRYLENIPRGTGDQPLFPSLHGRSSGSHAGLSNEFARLLVKAGVVVAKGRPKTGKGRQFSKKTFHSFRHFSLTRMVEVDIAPETRRMMGGHSLTSTTHLKYLHMRPEAQRDALAKMKTLTNGDAA